MFSEISQAQEEKCCVIPPVQGPWNKFSRKWNGMAARGWEGAGEFMFDVDRVSVPHNGTSSRDRGWQGVHNTGH
jgi:hypothetical protein